MYGLSLLERATELLAVDECRAAGLPMDNLAALQIHVVELFRQGVQRLPAGRPNTSPAVWAVLVAALARELDAGLTKKAAYAQTANLFHVPLSSPRRAMEGLRRALHKLDPTAKPDELQARRIELIRAASQALARAEQEHHAERAASAEGRRNGRHVAKISGVSVG